MFLRIIRSLRRAPIALTGCGRRKVRWNGTARRRSRTRRPCRKDARFCLGGTMRPTKPACHFEGALITSTGSRARMFCRTCKPLALHHFFDIEPLSVTAPSRRVSDQGAVDNATVLTGYAVFDTPTATESERIRGSVARNRTHRSSLASFGSALNLPLHLRHRPCRKEAGAQRDSLCP